MPRSTQLFFSFPVSYSAILRRRSPRKVHRLFLAKHLFDLLGSLLLGDAVLLSDLVSEAVLVTGDGGEVVRGELVELLAEGVLSVLGGVGHVG